MSVDRWRDLNGGLEEYGRNPVVTAVPPPDLDWFLDLLALKPALENMTSMRRKR